MARSAAAFVCQQCGFELPKWQGQCPNCGTWNSLVETLRQAQGRLGKRGAARKAAAVKPVRLSEVVGTAEKRIPTGIGELNRVLGGGIVPGSVVLVAGEPGIGKSTLLTQLAMEVSENQNTQKTQKARKPDEPESQKSRRSGTLTLRRSDVSGSPTRLPARQGSPVLYVCGEENPGQIKLRVDRLEASAKRKPSSRAQVEGSQSAKLLLLPETDVDTVIATIEREKPGLVIVDSIQTMVTFDLASSAGSVGQVSESTRRLLAVAKGLATPVFLVGHVTKEGTIAGPKVLEHMVDTVLELTGDRQHEFRILRTTKNRFGTTDEVGIFAMEDGGMQEVANPSDRFLADRQERTPGSAVVAIMEGTRPMLVEIQALVVPSPLVVPRRIASGVDQRRVQILTAVLTRRCGLRLANQDVYVNVAGGMTIREPAADLGIALAIASSLRNRALPAGSVAIGEVGLLGEVRKVSRFAQRLSEARALGFKRYLTAEEFGSLPQALRFLFR